MIQITLSPQAKDFIDKLIHSTVIFKSPCVRIKLFNGCGTCGNREIKLGISLDEFDEENDEMFIIDDIPFIVENALLFTMGKSFNISLDSRGFPLVLAEEKPSEINPFFSLKPR